MMRTPAHPRLTADPGFIGLRRTHRRQPRRRSSGPRPSVELHELRAELSLPRRHRTAPAGPPAIPAPATDLRWWREPVGRIRRALARRVAGVAIPQYGWDRNAGYATREHRDAIRAHGLTPHHRKSWQALQVLMAGDQLGLFDADEAVLDELGGADLVAGAFEGRADGRGPDGRRRGRRRGHRGPIKPGHR